MTKLTPYLAFSGNCREAMEFYKRHFGGELQIMSYGDHPDSCGEGIASQVMHACLSHGDFTLYASDVPGMEVTVGTNVQINAHFDSVDVLDKTFKGLAEGGLVIAEPHDAFWGDRFGVVKDRFGVQWMVTGPQKK